MGIPLSLPCYRLLTGLQALLGIRAVTDTWYDRVCLCLCGHGHPQNNTARGHSAPDRQPLWRSLGPGSVLPLVYWRTLLLVGLAMSIANSIPR